jgi:hypothetical protein
MHSITTLAASPCFVITQMMRNVRLGIAGVQQISIVQMIMLQHSSDRRGFCGLGALRRGRCIYSSATLRHRYLMKGDCLSVKRDKHVLPSAVECEGRKCRWWCFGRSASRLPLEGNQRGGFGSAVGQPAEQSWWGGGSARQTPKRDSGRRAWARLS